MKSRDVKSVLSYHRAIPAMIKLLAAERGDLEEMYDGLGAMDMDGMPHGTTPGRPAEALAMEVPDGIAERIQDIDGKIKILKVDMGEIQDAIDSINGRYKNVLLMRHDRGYSWGKISVGLGVPDSTVRHWYDRAVDRLGEALDTAPDIAGLLIRSVRARS